MKNCKINRIELENIKSFKRGKINFEDGITVISGLNGAGKSTIFEAIGHCLFGVGANKFIDNTNQFLRKGQKGGSIEVFFTGYDNQEYKISKDLKSGATLFFLSDSDEWFPMEDKDASAEVKKLLGLTGTTDLEEMFTDFIGPFQADFITPFVKRGKGADRKRHFDKILGISQWKELSKETSYLDKEFEHKIQGFEKENEIKEKQVVELPQKQEEIENSRQKKKEIESLLGKIEKEASLADEKVRRLETLEKALVEKNNTNTKLREELKGKKESLVRETGLLEKSQESLEIVNKHRMGYEIFRDQEKKKIVLEKKQAEREKLKDKISTLGSKIAREDQRVKSNRENNEKNLENISGEIKELEEKKNLVTEDLSKASIENAKAKTALDEIKSGIEKFQSVDIEIIKRKIEKIEDDLSRLSELKANIKKREVELKIRPEVEKVASEFEETEAKLGDVKDEISASKARIKSYKEGKNKLKEGICPYMGESCKNLGEWDPDDFFNNKIAELKALIKEKDDVKSNLEMKRKEAQSSREKLVSLMQVEKELKRERENIEQVNDNILGYFGIKDIKDLFSSFSHTARFMDDDEIESSVSRLNKDIDQYKLPDDLSKHPGFLDKIYQSFSTTLKDILKRMRYHENKASEERESKIQSRSKLDTQVNETKKQLKKQEKELSKIEKNLQKLEKDENNLNKQKTEMEVLKKDLENYESLDVLLSNANTKLENNRNSYNLYNRHLNDSRKVESLDESVRKLNDNINKISEGIELLSREIADLKEKFDKEELQNTRKEFLELNARIAADKQNIKSLSDKIEFLSREIEKMKSIQKEIKKTKREIREYEKSRDFATYLRKNVLEKIAGLAGRHIRNNISIPASGIYHLISGTNDELYWGDDYSIELRGKVGTRVDRQLSGGQFMMAVIALRLALLQKIGASIAFFDEPTSNLDEERRKNLAEALRSLDAYEDTRWYNQLFLVSHDESFHGITGHNIELELNDSGESEIVGYGKLERGFHHLKVRS